MKSYRLIASKYKIVAYDPRKAPKEGPITIEVHDTEGSTGFGKILKEIRLNKDDVIKYYGGNTDKGYTELLEKHGLISKGAKAVAQDGDQNSLYLTVYDDGDKGTYGIYLTIKSGHEEALDAILSGIIE